MSGDQFRKAADLEALTPISTSPAENHLQQVNGRLEQALRELTAEDCPECLERAARALGDDRIEREAEWKKQVIRIVERWLCATAQDAWLLNSLAEIGDLMPYDPEPFDNEAGA